MKHILDKGFKYAPSFDTDIRKTFDRLRRQKLEQERKEAEARAAKVQQFPLTNNRRST